MTGSDDDLLARLREGDPAKHLNAQPESMRALLRSSIDAAAGRPRRRLAGVGFGLVAVLALGIASPAIAGGVQHFLAQTGWIGTSPNAADTQLQEDNRGAPNSESDDSEWISVAADDFVDFSVSKFPKEITLPESYDPNKFAVAVATAQKQPGMTGLMQVTGIQGNYERAARCVWIDEWLTAHAAGDTARSAAAAAVLSASAAWPATVATDGGDIVDTIQATAKAAAKGDPAPAAKQLAINCAPIPSGVMR